MVSGNPQTKLDDARSLSVAEMMANPAAAIKKFHQAAMTSVQAFNMAEALQAYELAYDVAHQNRYTGSEHIVTCAFLVWYRGLDGNIDGANQAMQEAQSIAKTEIDKKTLGIVLRMMARNQPHIRAQLLKLEL